MPRERIDPHLANERYVREVGNGFTERRTWNKGNVRPKKTDHQNHFKGGSE